MARINETSVRAGSALRNRKRVKPRDAESATVVVAGPTPNAEPNGYAVTLTSKGGRTIRVQNKQDARLLELIEDFFAVRSPR